MTDLSFYFRQSQEVASSTSSNTAPSTATSTSDNTRYSYSATAPSFHRNIPPQPPHNDHSIQATAASGDTRILRSKVEGRGSQRKRQMEETYREGRHVFSMSYPVHRQHLQGEHTGVCRCHCLFMEISDYLPLSLWT